MTKFFQIFLTNLLIVIALIPMVILLNSIIAWNDNPIFWTIISFLLLIGISYSQYKDSRKDDDKLS